MDFIVGEKFYSVADFIYSNDFLEDFNKLISTFDSNKLNELNIVYFHTMYKEHFFNVIKDLKQKFILVSHNSDHNVNTVENLPDNVIKWFSQNVNCKSDKLESLPIGLENSRWFPHLQKKQRILNKVNEKKNYRNLIYVNHNIGTNVNQRQEVYMLLQNKPWATLKYGFNGQDYGSYIDEIYNHKFVVCPEGNGIDTHRKWETLYLNSIPIEKRSINNSFYTDLPICFVDNWNELTEDFLNSEYDRITNTTWNMDKLNMSYWTQKIKNSR